MRGFKTSGYAFRLPYSIAFDCSIRPFSDLFHLWLYISHLSRYLHLDEGTLYRVMEFAHLEDPKCYAGSSVAAGRVSLAGQDEGERSDEERYPGPAGWGLSCWTSTPTLAKKFYSSNHRPKPWNQFGSQRKRLRKLIRTIRMATWNVQGCRGKVQEILAVKHAHLIEVALYKYITSHHITTQHIISHRNTSQHITLHHNTLHHIISHHNTSHRNTSHYITSQHITSNNITSNTSHHIPSQHITSHQTHHIKHIT